MGFLFYALKHHRQLPFWQPAYTAHLEVEYKAVSFRAEQVSEVKFLLRDGCLYLKVSIALYQDGYVQRCMTYHLMQALSFLASLSFPWPWLCRSCKRASWCCVRQR